MISERKFAISHTSFWREATPSADNFLRHINITCQRYIAPYEGRASTGLNGVVNEAAFRLAAAKLNGYATMDTEAEIEEIWIEVTSWLGNLYLGPDKTTSKIRADIEYISGRISEYLITQDFRKVEFRPKFPGCGLISSCEGDVLADDVLIEVKAGGRSFRSIDLRQLFIYLALARQAGRREIKRLCLLNPRWGVAWTSTVEEAAIGCGASSAADLSDEIVRGAVALGVSS